MGLRMLEKLMLAHRAVFRIILCEALAFADYAYNSYSHVGPVELSFQSIVHAMLARMSSD